MPKHDLSTAQVGDIVTRLLMGRVPMDLYISELTEDIVKCGDWTFNRHTGYEIDEDLSISASRLIRHIPKAPNTEA
jgi:hypothetical protein